MSSLTETAYYTRRAINWTILGIIAYFILRISWTVFVAVWLIIFPPHAPPPNHAFGKLPAVKFPAQATPSGTLTFELQTIQGTLPTASSSAAVYFMPKPAPNLLGLSQTQDFAQKLQFDPTPIQESKNIYRFNDTDEPLRRMRYDIVSKNFIIRYAFERDTSLFREKNFPQESDIKLNALHMLQSYNLFPDDLDDGPVTLMYLKLLADQLIPTTSLSQSDAVRVDFFRHPIGDMPILTQSADEAPISIIYSGSTNIKKQTLQFAYTYWPIDYLTSATYPLKTTSEAWQELQQQGGFIVRYPKNSSTAVIRNVYLAYYDSFDPQTYLQPIFVFEGDNGFIGYVPAVTSQWTE